MIPDRDTALYLHKKYGSNEKIIEHCKTVATAAQILAEEFAKSGKFVDIKLVTAGALLHDIGRSKTNKVDHGLVGSEILKKEGLDEKLAEIVRKHVGAGITKEEARKIGLPELDYVPTTLEERIVCFADKMVDSNKIRPFEVEVKRFIREGHDVQRLIELKESLKKELGKDPEQVILSRVE